MNWRNPVVLFVSGVIIGVVLCMILAGLGKPEGIVGGSKPAVTDMKDK